MWELLSHNKSLCQAPMYEGDAPCEPFTIPYWILFIHLAIIVIFSISALSIEDKNSDHVPISLMSEVKSPM